jgi:hypothetical protein
MHSRPARVARGLVAASVSTFAALSHAAAGSQAPSIVAVALCLVVASFACIALAGRRLTPWRTAVAVLLSQAVYHALFTAIPAVSGSAESVFGMSGAHVHGHAHAAASAPLASSALAPSAADAGAGMVMSGAHAHGAGHSDALMWAAHGLAAFVTVAVVLHGERVFWRLFDTLRLTFLTLFRPVAAARTPLSVSVPVVVRRMLAPIAPPFLSSVKHRGPPRGVSAACAA